MIENPVDPAQTHIERTDRGLEEQSGSDQLFRQATFSGVDGEEELTVRWSEPQPVSRVRATVAQAQSPGRQVE